MFPCKGTVPGTGRSSTLASLPPSTFQDSFRGIKGLFLLI